MDQHAYSIRDSLHEALLNFTKQSGFDCPRLQEIIREFVSLLAAYREEGLPLFPEVFIFGSVEGLKALAPSSDYIAMDELPLAHESASLVIKNCAPLAVGGWAIFLVKETETRLRYGLFRGLRHSLATGAEESMRGLGLGIPVISIRNRGPLVVEIRSSADQQFTATLKTAAPKPSPVESDVSRFVDAATSTIVDAQLFKTYLSRLLLGILQYCHGTLLAVVEHPPGQAHPTLTDGVWLSPPIRLAEFFKRAQETKELDAFADLKSAEALLSGMIRSDGLVLFGSDGSLLAYRVFLRPEPMEANSLPAHGGGRRRTYELMKLRVPTVFRTAFFRSQDGETGCEGASDE